LTSFWDIGLIDANSVNPDSALSLCMTQMLQRGVQGGADEKRRVVEDYALVVAHRTPSIRQAFVFGI
jgi:hypothetical protein